jgi:hypothetical protein
MISNCELRVDVCAGIWVSAGRPTATRTKDPTGRSDCQSALTPISTPAAYWKTWNHGSARWHPYHHRARGDDIASTRASKSDFGWCEVPTCRFSIYALNVLLRTKGRWEIIRQATQICLQVGLAILLMLSPAGCAKAPPACVEEPASQADVVFVLQHGWHTDLAIPTQVLRGNMTVFQRIFPGLKVLVIGFGKRTFMMAPVTTSGDLVIGPFPGKGAILVVGLKGPPSLAYDDGVQASVILPAGGPERLSEFIWQTLSIQDGKPVPIREGFFPGSMFYATQVEYAGTYTCNTWTADALHAAGVDVNPQGAVFAGQTMRQVERNSGGFCAIKNKP